MNRASTATLALLLLAVPTAARAEEGFANPGATVIVVTPAAPPPDAAPPESARPEITLAGGARGSLIRSAGLDPYATNDFFLQGTAGLGLTVLHAGRASILLWAEYAGGQRNGTARGQDASLALHRLGGALETRYHLARRFYLAARLAPAAFLMHGSITESSLDRPLTASAWTWGLDATGSAGLLLGSTGPRGTKFWMTLDLGYAFAGEGKLAYSPAASDDDPRKFGAVTLPALRPAGPIGRLGMAVAF
jgi:hypothetical protein